MLLFVLWGEGAGEELLGCEVTLESHLGDSLFLFARCHIPNGALGFLSTLTVGQVAPRLRNRNEIDFLRVL